MKRKKQELRVQLLAETKERIHLLAELTFRQPGQVIDWAIAELYEREMSKKSQGIGVVIPPPLPTPSPYPQGQLAEKGL